MVNKKFYDTHFAGNFSEMHLVSITTVSTQDQMQSLIHSYTHTSNLITVSILPNVYVLSHIHVECEFELSNELYVQKSTHRAV